MNLEGAGVAGRRRLAAGDEELQSEGDIDVEIESLDFKGSAQTHRCFKLNQP